MKNITDNYDSHTVDELKAEIALRGLAAPAGALKADLVAELEEDDTKPVVTPPLPPPAKSPLPVVTIPEQGVYIEKSQPDDHEFTDGIYVYSIDDSQLHGEKFALCIHDPDTYENTHSLKNTAHFWQGTKAEFKAAFEKE